MSEAPRKATYADLQGLPEGTFGGDDHVRMPATGAQSHAG